MDFHCKYCGKTFQHRCNVYTHQKKCKQYNHSIIYIKSDDSTVSSIGFLPSSSNLPFREILSIHDDLFNEYQSRDDAINNLLTATIQCNPILIIKSLYFSVQYHQYPIILSNGHYRYSCKNEVIDTVNGIDILNILLCKVHNAMIRANIEIISKKLISGELNYLYDNYDIGKIQNNLFMMINKHLINKIKKEFDHLIEVDNSSHPFLSHRIVIFT